LDQVSFAKANPKKKAHKTVAERLRVLVLSDAIFAGQIKKNQNHNPVAFDLFRCWPGSIFVGGIKNKSTAERVLPGVGGIWQRGHLWDR